MFCNEESARKIFSAVFTNLWCVDKKTGSFLADHPDAIVTDQTRSVVAQAINGLSGTQTIDRL